MTAKQPRPPSQLTWSLLTTVGERYRRGAQSLERKGVLKRRCPLPQGPSFLPQWHVSSRENKIRSRGITCSLWAMATTTIGARHATAECRTILCAGVPQRKEGRSEGT